MSSVLPHVLQVIVTGAAGFIGANLVNYLLENDYRVCGIVSPNSAHNSRLREKTSLKLIEANLVEVKTERLVDLIDDEYDYLFHVAWTGNRNDTIGQVDNLLITTKIVSVAKTIGCKKIICTGSQAEYGQVAPHILQEEPLPVFPISAYGAAKVAACSIRAIENGLDLGKAFFCDWKI